MRNASLLAIFLILFLYISKSIKISEAQVMSGDRFNLQSEAGNPAEESDTNTDDKLSEQANLYDVYLGQNYKIENGFGHSSSDTPFSFSLSNDLIEFGTLTPNNPVTRTNTISVLSKSTVGYAVYVFENHQLQTSESPTFIPDATCDNGACTQTTSASWRDTVYGFGYRCDNKAGIDCLGDFLNPSFFKQFPDSSRQEEWEQVMRGLPQEKKKISQITYKINISNAQKPAKYANTLNYIAIPNF